jgi:hypothetical protein
MPIDAEIIDLAKELVRDDVLGGFDGVLSPDPDNDPVFSIELEESGVDESDAVAASDSIVVVPWVYRCVHTGTFLDIPPTYIHFALRGATFVSIAADDSEEWIYHRFVDFLCALHHIGVSTSARPALNVAEYLEWDAERGEST